MLTTVQTWLIYPDDAKKLQEDLIKRGFCVNYDEKNNIWTIKKGKQLFSAVKKPAFINRGALAGTRLERVRLLDALTISKALDDCGYFASKFSKPDKQLLVFIGLSSKKDIYKNRMERISVKP